MDDLELHDANERKNDCLDNTVKIVTEDMRMSFGIDNFAVFAVKRSKEAQCEGIINRFRIKEVGKMSYEYLTIVEKGDICQEKMKSIIKKEYFKQFRTVLKSNICQKYCSSY